MDPVNLSSLAGRPQDCSQHAELARRRAEIFADMPSPTERSAEQWAALDEWELDRSAAHLAAREALGPLWEPNWRLAPHLLLGNVDECAKIARCNALDAAWTALRGYEDAARRAPMWDRIAMRWAQKLPDVSTIASFDAECAELDALVEAA